MKPALDESQIEKLLENLPPDISPRLERRLEYAPWTYRAVRRHRMLTALSLAALAVIAFILLTPQGRAFAQTIFEFFIRTDQGAFPLSDEEIDLFYAPIPTYTLSLVEVTSQPFSTGSENCSSLENQRTYDCEIQRIERLLGYDIKEFSSAPTSWFFRQAGSQNDAVITYQTGGGYLELRQGTGNFPPDSDWGKVLASAVQPVKIGEYYGEYVDGSFGVKNGDTNLTWDAVGADQRIRWKEGNRWFELVELAGPGTSGYLDRESLLSLASNMVYQPGTSEQTTNIDYDFIPNIFLAEKISGLDVKEPTILPVDMTFDYAKYDPERKNITLIYGYRSLRIVQTPVESVLIKNLDSYKDVETVKVGGAIGQFGVSPAQKTIWESATPPVFPTNNSYNVLLWEKDGMVYQIYFDQSFSGGGYLTKEQLIQIAESLQ